MGLEHMIVSYKDYLQHSSLKKYAEYVLDYKLF